MMSNTLLESVVKKNRARLIPFMLALYVLAFLDRSNISFAKETYQLDTGLSNEAYALGAGIFFVVYAFLGVPANLLMRTFGARRWIGCTTLLWGVLSAAMAWADTEAKFLLVRTLLGAAEAGLLSRNDLPHFTVVSQQNRASIMGLCLYGRAAGPDAGIAFIRCAAGDGMDLWAIPAGSGCLSLKACSPSPRERSPSSGWTIRRSMPAS